jgi:outer membrane protein TolC
MQLTRIICGLWAGAAIAMAADTNAPANTKPLSLEECFQIALKHNLDVQIVRINPEVARFSLSGAYGGYDPSFFLRGANSFNKSPQTYNAAYNFTTGGNTSDTDSFSSGLSGVAPYGLQYSISAQTYNEHSTSPTAVPQNRETSFANFGVLDLRQPLLKNFWIDPTRFAIQVSKKNLKMSELDLKGQVMSTMTSVEKAYYDLIFAKENVIVYEKALELADRLLMENKKKVQVGAMAVLDEKQAQSQVAARRADLLSAKQSLSIRQNALKSLLSDNFSEWQDLAIEPQEKLGAAVQLFSRQESWHKGMTMRTDLLRSRQQAELQDINLRFYKNQLYPQLDLFGTLSYSGSGQEYANAWNQVWDGAGPANSIGAMVTVPLTNRKAKSQYQQVKSNKKQVLLQLKQLEQNVMIQIDDAIKIAQTAFDRVDATKQARAYAEEALKAEQKKLEAGTSTSFFVLSLQRDLTSARSSEISALAEYNKAVADVALAEGSTLERNKVDFQIK